MDEGFTTSHKYNLAYAEMHRVKYQESVMTYVDKLIGLKEKANMSGCAWCTVLVNGLPHELGKDLAKLRGEKLKEDDALRSAIKVVGLVQKTFTEFTSSRTRALGQPPLEKAMAMANASGNLRRETQLRRRNPLLLGRKTRRQPPLGLDLGNQDSLRTRSMRR